MLFHPCSLRRWTKLSFDFRCSLGRFWSAALVSALRSLAAKHRGRGVSWCWSVQVRAEHDREYLVTLRNIGCCRPKDSDQGIWWADSAGSQAGEGAARMAERGMRASGAVHAFICPCAVWKCRGTTCWRTCWRPGNLGLVSHRVAVGRRVVSITNKLLVLVPTLTISVPSLGAR